MFAERYRPLVSDELVEAFNVMARDSFRLAYREKRLQPALDLISAFLDLDVGEKLRGRALHHRSIVLEMFDRYDEAYADLLEAYRLATDGDLFHRHALELGLNMNANRRGDRENDAGWGELTWIGISPPTRVSPQNCDNTGWHPSRFVEGRAAFLSSTGRTGVCAGHWVCERARGRRA